jgi:hypothetical protein
MSLVHESVHISKPSDDDRHLSDSGGSCKLSYSHLKAVPTSSHTCWTLKVTVSSVSEQQTYIVRQKLSVVNFKISVVFLGIRSQILA